MSAAAGVRLLAEAGESTPSSAIRPDRGEFAALYRANVDAVYGFCFRRLGHREAAEDATTQVFVQALAAFPRYRGGSAKGWLFAIANRVVIDHYRSARRDAPLDRVGDRADPAPDPADCAVRAELLRTVRALVNELPDEQRRVIELRLAGPTGAEIAEAIGRSHGTVRNLQHQTLTTLRNKLGLGRVGADGDA